MLCAEPKEHKRFRPGTRPGGIGFPDGRIGDRGEQEIVYVPNVYVPFPALDWSLDAPFSLLATSQKTLSEALSERGHSLSGWRSHRP